MKKKSVWLTACLVAGSMWTSCTTGPKVAENEFWIEGTLENVGDGEILRLFCEENGALREVARDTLTNGRFSFRDTISSLGRYDLRGMGDNFAPTWADVWLAPGKKVTITGEDPYLRTWKVESDIQEQKDQNILSEAVRAEWKEKGRITVEQNQWYRLMQEAPNDSIRQIASAKIDSLKVEEEKIEDIMTPKELAALREIPIGRVWFDEYTNYAQSLAYDPNSPYIDEIKALYDRLSEAEKQTPKGKMIVHYMNLPKAVKIGDIMPDADLYDVNGGLHHLVELKGKYILLDFWSTGCGPCLKSIPELEEIAELYKEKIAVVSISQDPEERWKNFVIAQKLKGNQWNELRGRSGLFAALRIRGIPYYVLVSPDGKIQETWSGYSEGSLKTKMESLFK